MFRSNNSIEALLRQRLFVTVKQGHNFSGVLLHTDRRKDGQYAFADIKVYAPGNPPTSAVGELYIDRDNIAYVQKLPADVDG